MSQYGTAPAAVTPTRDAAKDDDVMPGSEDDLPVKDVWNLGDEVWVRRTAGGATPGGATSSSSGYTYYAGIICYVGEVLFAPGDDWVGIRLTGDSAGQGKNDGAVHGMRYFAAPPNSGLFVRSSALRVRSSKATPMTTTPPSRSATMERATPPPAVASNAMERTPARPDTAAQSSSTKAPPAPSATSTKAAAAASSKNGNKKGNTKKQGSKEDSDFPDALSPDALAAQKKTTKPAAAAKKAPAAKKDPEEAPAPAKAATTEPSPPKAPPASKSTNGKAAAADDTKRKANQTAAQKSAPKAAPVPSTTATTTTAAAASAPTAPKTSNASSKAATHKAAPKTATPPRAKPPAQETAPEDEFRLHSNNNNVISPIRADDDNEERQQLLVEQAERGLTSSPQRQRAPEQGSSRRDHRPWTEDDEDKFDWSLSQQRWIRSLLGCGIVGMWILAVLMLVCGLEGVDADGSDDIPSSNTTAAAPYNVALGDGMDTLPRIHHLHMPSPHAWLPASLLLLLSVVAGMLRLPLCQIPRDVTVTPLAVYTSRLAAVVLALTSLVVVVYIAVFAFVLDDSAAKTHAMGQIPRWFLWLFVDVLIILLPSCVALMLGFYPGSTPSERAEVDEHNPTVNQSFQSEVVPLLNGSNDEDEEAGNYQLMQEDENANEEEATGTNRIRGSRRLLQMAASQVVYLYLGCALLLLRLPFSLAIPHFVSTTLTALSQGHYADAHREILALAICGSIDAFLDFWCVFLFGYANLRIVKRIRLDLFQRLLHMECAFFDAHHSGTLTSRLNSDCSTMASDLTWFFRFSIESIVRITGIAGYMLVRSPQLAGCALAIVPAVAVVNKIYGDWLARNAAAVQDALASTQTVAQEALTHVRTVISLGAEQQIFQSYRDRVLKHYDLNVRQTFWQGVYYMVVSTFLINTVVQASLLWFGAYLIFHDRLTADVLLAFMLYQGQLQSETMNLFQSYSSLIKSSGAGDQVFSLLDRRTPPPGLGYGGVSEEDDPDDRSMALEFERVTFRYPSRPEHKVLDGMDWKVAAGKTVALVGPSGCGKSTVLGLVQRLYDPSDGRIYVNGRDLRQKDLVQYRKQIGVVTQDCVLFDGTIFENIVFGYDERDPYETDEEIEARVTRAAELANLTDFIRTLPTGLETQVGEGGTQLSGGQKQRLAIARAIYRQPALLILDEATSSLDAASERLVQDALDHLLAQRKGMTTLIVAHRLQTVQESDAICVLEHGKIAEQGTHHELMRRRGLYYAMVGRFVRTGAMNQ